MARPHGRGLDGRGPAVVCPCSAPFLLLLAMEFVSRVARPLPHALAPVEIPPLRARRARRSLFSPWRTLLCCCPPEFADGLCHPYAPRSRATRAAEANQGHARHQRAELEVCSNSSTVVVLSASARDCGRVRRVCQHSVADSTVVAVVCFAACSPSVVSCTSALVLATGSR